MSEEMMQSLTDYSSIQKSSSKKNLASAVKNIPVQLHVVGEDDGKGYLSTKIVLDALCDINIRFQSSKMHFYLYDEINHIAQSEFYNQSEFQYAIDMMQRNNVNTEEVLNIYFINSIAGATSGIIAGYYMPSTDAVAVVNNEVGTGKTVLAHELGHYFGLPHTFGASGTLNELVDGSNCSFAGDNFCDTPADPNSSPWNCPYTAGEIDPNGDLYVPDPTFYMSYAAPTCQTRYSQEQRDYMNFYLDNSRTNLANTDSLDKTELPQTILVLPNDNSTNMDYIVDFQWFGVAGADYYNLLVSRDIGFQNIVLDVDWQATNFVATLEPDSLYFWKVVPYHKGNTCTNYTFAYKLETRNNAGVLIPSTNPFSGIFDIKVFPNPVSDGLCI